MPAKPSPYLDRGLLEGIAETALDSDYYEVRPPQSRKSKLRGSLASGIGIALFALLVTIAIVQNRTDRPVNRVERNTLVSNIQDRKATLEKGEEQAGKLRSEVSKLRALSSNTNPEFETLRVTTADRAAHGPGIVVTADSSTEGNDDGRITDIDLQVLVNGLWYAGAEAIAINGNRLGTLSSIRRAGLAITVNFKSIGSPYRLVVLGNSESMADRLGENPGGRYWAKRVRDAGLRFDVQNEENLSVPAAPSQRLSIVHAEAAEGES